MALPDVTFEIEDGATGSLPPNVAGASVKMGICSRGIPNTLKGYSDDRALRRDLGSGPLVEAIAATLAVAGGPVYACPLPAASPGTVGAVTHVGPGTGTVAAAVGPDRSVRARVGTPGALGTMTVQFEVDGGGFAPPVTSNASAPWDYVVPGSTTTLRFPAGTYVAGETYLFGTNGTLSHRDPGDTGAGTGPTVARQASSPVDVFDVTIEIVTDGALGAGSFSYSLDGANSWSPTIAIPLGGVYAIPGAGIVLTFAGTFTDDDTYSFVTTAAGFSAGDVSAAMDVITGLSTEWGHVHVVGQASSAAGAAVMATTLDTKLTAAETAFRFAFGVIECPSTEADSALLLAFAAFASRRVMVCAGDAAVQSPLTGRIHRRNAAWVVTARLALIDPHVDPAWVGQGHLPMVQSLYRNEAQTPGLDEARFTTLRTHIGRPGYYVTNGRMMAPGGSDYTYVMNRRVMDRACQIARAAELPYLNQDVNVDTETGKIDEKAAQQFEADVNGQLKAGVVGPGYASGSRVVLSRDANLLAGEEAEVTVRIVGKAYLKGISTSIGFVNPALAA